MLIGSMNGDLNDDLLLVIVRRVLNVVVDVIFVLECAEALENELEEDLQVLRCWRGDVDVRVPRQGQ